MTAEQQVIEILRASEAFVAHLRTARQLGLADWCLGGGALRDVVWSRLADTPVPPPRDLDLAYYDPLDLSPQREAALERRLAELAPETPWEVRNQARMHLWHASRTGEAVAAVGSLAGGLAVWPEPCTAVGAWLDRGDRIRLVAPLGLDDLLARRVRWNPARISRADWLARAATKRWSARWPGVAVVLPG